MTGMRSIYFIRHGEKEASSTYNSISNKKLELTRNGKEQAERISVYLASCDIEHIYSSDYSRALQTSKPTSDRLHLPVAIDKRLGERVLLTEDTSAAVSKSEFIKSQRDWSYRAPGGESLEEAVMRFDQAVGSLLLNTDGAVAIFTHGRVLQSYLAKILNSRELSAAQLIIGNGDVYRVDYIDNEPVKLRRVFAPIKDTASYDQVPTMADTIVVRNLAAKKVLKTHIFKQSRGHNVQANIYEKNSLDLLHSIGQKIPGNRKLLDHGCYISMNYILGRNFGDLITEKDDVTRCAVNLGKTLRDMHDKINDPSLSIPFQINPADSNLNSQCALNFSELTAKNTNSSHAGHLKSIFLSNLSIASATLDANPNYLDAPEIVHGDFKPDNIIVGSSSTYLVDPHLSYGRISCDLGKMIARLYLTKPETAPANVAALLAGYKPSANILKEIRHMAGFDILNTFSRLVAKNQLAPIDGIISHKLTLDNLEHCMREVVPALFGDAHILILRHLDDIQDFNVSYRNTPIVDEERVKVPGIVNSVLTSFDLLQKKRIKFIISPQIRAKQTADLVIDGIRKARKDIDMDIFEDKRILDLYHGEYVVPSSYRVGEKLPALGIANKAYTEQTFGHKNIDYRNGDPMDGRYPELVGLFSKYGESQREFSLRFYDFIESLINDVSTNNDTLYVIVAHTAIVFRLFELSYLINELVDTRGSVAIGDLSFREWEQAFKLDLNPGHQKFIDHGEIKTLDISNMVGYPWRFMDERTYLIGGNLQ